MVAGINGASNSPANKKKTKDYDPSTGEIKTAWSPFIKKGGTVDVIKEKSKGTGWGRITRQADQERLEKLMKKEGY